MTNQESPASAFAAGAVQLYTALLGAGEVELSKPLLESTMNAAAAVNRCLTRPGCWASEAAEEGVERERQLAEELLRKSLFWICQVPDATAQLHGGAAFREGLRLLLLLRNEEPATRVVAEV